MTLQLGSRSSDIFIVIYLLLTLVARFLFEGQLRGNILISLAIGGMALLFLWALVKVKFLNPTYFGLLGTKEDDKE